MCMHATYTSLQETYTEWRRLRAHIVGSSHEDGMSDCRSRLSVYSDEGDDRRGVILAKRPRTIPVTTFGLDGPTDLSWPISAKSLQDS